MPGLGAVTCARKRSKKIERPYVCANSMVKQRDLLKSGLRRQPVVGIALTAKFDTDHFEASARDGLAAVYV
jgi:hypothetical protein